MKFLIIVDMQNDFLDGALGNGHCRAAIPEVVKLIEDGRKDWHAIFLTRDTHFDNYENTLEGRKLPVPHCKYHTHGWNVNDDIRKALEVTGIYVNKPTFGSFELLTAIEDIITETLDRFTPQDNPMRDRIGMGLDTLEFHVCGVCTSICVLANVVLLRAKYPDAKIVVHQKACGDVTKEMHDAALICFKSQQCEVE